MGRSRYTFYQYDIHLVHNLSLKWWNIPFCEVSRNSPDSFSNERGLRSKTYHLLKHPVFHKNRSKTFWDNRYKDTQTDKQTDRHIYAGENNTCPKTRFKKNNSIAFYQQKFMFINIIVINWKKTLDRKYF